MTRGETAIFLGRALQLSPAEGSDFKDLSSSVVDRYVQAGQKSGFIHGYLDGTFRPNAEVTRSELAIFLTNAFDLEHLTANRSNFSDVTPQMNAYAAIMTLAKHGITTGYPDGSFRPDQSVTRGEFAAMLVRASNVKKVGHAETTGYIIWRDESSIWLISNLSKDEIERIGIEGKTEQELSEDFNQGGIIFSLDGIDKAIVTKLEVGQQVTVTFDGTVNHSAPALGNASNVDILPSTWEEVSGHVVDKTRDNGKETILLVEGISQKEALE